MVVTGMAAVQGMPHQVHFDGPPGCAESEDARLATLHSLRLLPLDVNAAPDPEVQRILRLVQDIFHAPNALICLFDHHRVFITEAEGLFSPGDFPWRWSFCGWTMASEQHQVMAIPDTAKDARFSDNEMVTGANGVKAYMGAPLVSANGHRIGCICFADVKTRSFDAQSAAILANLAEITVRYVEQSKAHTRKTIDTHMLLKRPGVQMQIDHLPHCMVLLDVSVPGWKIMFVNDKWETLTGTSRSALQECTLAEVMQRSSADMDTHALPSAVHQQMVNMGQAVTVEGAALRKVWRDAHPSAAVGLVERSRMNSNWTDTSSSPANVSSTQTSAAHTDLLRTNQSEASNSSSLSQPQTRRLLLTFRPANQNGLDSQSAAVTVPSGLPGHHPGSGAPENNLYFMRVEAVGAGYDQACMPPSWASARSVNSSSNFGSNPVDGLKLGQLLGRGSFGSVYSGKWFSAPVAVKVVELPVSQLKNEDQSPEVLFSTELRHPHIVSTLKHAVRYQPEVLTSTSTSEYIGDTAFLPCSVSARPSDLTPANAALTPVLFPPTCLNTSFFSGPDSASALSTTSVTSMDTSSAETFCTLAASLSKGHSDNRVVAHEVAGSVKTTPATPTVVLRGGGPRDSVVKTLAGLTLEDVPGNIFGGLVPEGGPDDMLKGGMATAASADGMSHDFFHMSQPHGAVPVHPQHAMFHMSNQDTHRPTVNTSSTMSIDSHASAAAFFDMSAMQYQAHQGVEPPRDMCQTWLVMEFCDRGTLQDAVDKGWLRDKPSAVQGCPCMLKILTTAYEIASALHFLHAHEVVHGDLSAWNILLTSSASTGPGSRGWIAKIGDFGMARALEARTCISTRTYGTITHQPPETLMHGIVGRETDVYAFGVLLWQMWTGSRPWVGLTQGQIIMAVSNPNSALVFPESTPPEYVALTRACTAFDRHARPTMRQVVATLTGMKQDVQPKPGGVSA